MINIDESFEESVVVSKESAMIEKGCEEDEKEETNESLV